MMGLDFNGKMRTTWSCATPTSPQSAHEHPGGVRPRGTKTHGGGGGVL